MTFKSTFLVDCKHPDERWDGFQEFEVAYSAFDDVYWASCPSFGTGKSFKTPEAAIRHLARDNGARVINIAGFGIPHKEG